MQWVWADTARDFAILSADRVAAVLARKPNAAIALPTGQTPVGLYAELRARAGAGELSGTAARWFNLDEYLGVAGDQPLSYARFVRSHLLDALGVPAGHVCLIRGDAPDPEAECRRYDEAIEAAGGLDLAILGLGANGHIAFNEPGSPWDCTTHVVTLSEQTRANNARPNDLRTIPERGITMGIGTLRAAREILLLVTGASKRQALEALRRGVADSGWPVTSLLDHPNLTVVCDAGLR